MRNYIFITLGLVISTSFAFSQDNYGFYGKKTFLDVSSSSYFPILYNVTTNGKGSALSASGNSLQQKEDWFNIGLRASIGRALQSNVGLSLEFGFDQITLGDNVLYGNSSSNTYITDHESLRINSFLVMPKLEISGPNGILPNGLVHQVGIGVHMNKVVEKNYLVFYSNGSKSGGPNADISDQTALFSKYDLDESYKMLQLMYGLKMRTPVGKSLLINYGFRYTLDFGFSDSYVAREIQSYQFRNLIAFDLGLTLPF